MKKLAILVVTVGVSLFAMFFNMNGVDFNKTIDEFATKSKILGQNFGNFLDQSSPQMQSLQKNLGAILLDINKSVKDATSSFKGLEKNFYQSFDANISEGNLSITNSEPTTQKDEIREIINLDKNLIDSVSIKDEVGAYEVEIYGAKPISKAEFNQIGRESAKIVRQYKRVEEKVQVYYLNDFIKFSGKF